jgi:predicted transcriptional regulator
MERLSKKQREILEYLDEAYPHRVLKSDVLSEFDDGNTRMEIKILEKNKLIKVHRYSGRRIHDGTRYRLGNVSLTITPKGVEKLRETFSTRLIDSAYNNPWAVVAIVVSLLLGIITLWK